MSNRRYKTAYNLAKTGEVLSWILLGGGVIFGLSQLSRSASQGFAFIISSVVFGLMLVVNVQMVLVYMDIEDNTRRTADEAVKTNAMLAETLGTIMANVAKIARKEDQS